MTAVNFGNPVDPPRPVVTPPKKPLRRVVVKESQHGEWYYVTVANNGEPLYTSETFKRRAYAIKAARREHEGRGGNYDYLLEYDDPDQGLIRETL